VVVKPVAPEGELAHIGESVETIDRGVIGGRIFPFDRLEPERGEGEGAGLDRRRDACPIRIGADPGSDKEG